jgi:2-isopropylmalate synthase
VTARREPGAGGIGLNMDTAKRLCVYDTTLRDGNQALGISLSCADKLRIADRLHELGIHYLEGGWPTPGNSADLKFFAQAAKRPYRDRVVVFGSTRRKGTSCARDPLVQTLTKSGVRTATVFGKAWDLHVKKVIRTTLSENLDMIAETVSYLRRHFDVVFYDAEHFFDGFRANPSYALKCLDAARQAGTDCSVLCDTNGGLLPGEFVEMFREVSAHYDGPLGVHMHNDSGSAAANTYLAVRDGATHIQGTMNGLGERCGNTNLCTVIPSLQLKRGYRILSEEQLARLTETSIFVSEVANVAHDIRQPYVGESAFSHKAGTHADGVRKARESFEHVAPEAVGNARRFVVSDQAGSSTILARLTTIAPDIAKGDPRVKEVLRRIVQKESEGYQFEAADGSFELVVREVLGHFVRPFRVNGFRVIEEHLENGDLLSEATIKVTHGGQAEHTAANGDGPVNALDGALRKALVRFFPSLATVKLEDFKVRVLDAAAGTEAKVRVLIESSDGAERWGTVGVSTNIIEASWLALVDSLEFKLMREHMARTGTQSTHSRKARR